MSGSSFAKNTFLVASLTLGAALAWGLPVPPAQAAEQAPRVSPVGASTEGLGLTAPGAVEDTLKACLARIPKDASAGQRLIAEQSCGRDEQDRLPIQAVPGRR